MSLPVPRILTVVAAVVATAALLTGCGSGVQPDPTASAGTPAATATPGQDGPTPAPSASAVAATCEGIIDPDTLADLQAQGWTYRQSPFSAGGITLDDGLQCEWGDLDGATTANLMLFGWAPVTTAESTAMQDELVAEGWEREASSDGTFVWDAFGMTYEFGEGWVTVSDLREQLPIIRRPQG